MVEDSRETQHLEGAPRPFRRRSPRRPAPDAESPDAPIVGTQPDSEPAKPPPRRRRGARTRTETPADATPETAAAAEPDAAADEQPRPARRRRPRKSPAEATAAASDESAAQAAPAAEPPSRSRRGRGRGGRQTDALDTTGVSAPKTESSEAKGDDAEQPSRSGRGRRGRGGRQTDALDTTGVSAPKAESSEAKGDAVEPPSRSGRGRRGRGGESEAGRTAVEKLQKAFMHPSEKEFADLLDYYHINYLYEPRSFPLRWDGNRVVEMFTPDFYLPEYDQYFELTTMKQSLVTQKNRKLRHVREMYPEVNVQLLYRRDLMRLMGKYGFGPLSEVSVEGTEQVLFDEGHVQARVRELGKQVSRDYAGKEPVLVGVLRGVVVFMADLMRMIDLPLQIEFMEISHYGERKESIDIIRDVTTELKGRHVLVIEDIVDTGLTLRYLLEHLQAKGPASLKVCTLLDKSVRRMADIPIEYVGFEVPDEFVIGYGLDYGGRYRNLPYIGVLQPVEPKAVAQR